MKMKSLYLAFALISVAGLGGCSSDEPSSDELKAYMQVVGNKPIPFLRGPSNDKLLELKKHECRKIETGKGGYLCAVQFTFERRKPNDRTLVRVRRNDQGKLIGAGEVTLNDLASYEAFMLGKK